MIILEGATIMPSYYLYKNNYNVSKLLKKVSLPEGLEQLGDYPVGNSSVKYNIPSTVKHLGMGYYNSDNIVSDLSNQIIKDNTGRYIKNTKIVDIDSEPVVTNVPEGRLRQIDIQCADDAEIYHVKDNVYYLESSFSNYPNLKYITLPEGLTYLYMIYSGYRTGTSLLRELTLPSTLTHIDCDYHIIHDATPKIDAWASASGSKLSYVPNMSYLDLSKIDNAKLVFDERWKLSFGWSDGLGMSRPRGYQFETSIPTLVFMPKGSVLGKDDDSKNLNVIYTEDGETFECPQLEFYDYMQNNGVFEKESDYIGGRKYYAIPHEFTATTAKYKRNFTNGGGGKKFTVCLPFAVDAKEFGTFYEFTKFDKETGQLTFTPVTSAKTEARHPYLFMPKSADVEISAENVLVEKVEDGLVETGSLTTDEVVLEDGSKFIGVYEYHTVPDNHFNFTNDNFRRVKSGAAFCAPFRGYFWLEGASNAGAKDMVAVYEDTTTGISSVEPFDPSMDMEDDAWYNMQGQRVENPKHGVFIRNGKKVILK